MGTVLTVKRIPGLLAGLLWFFCTTLFPAAGRADTLAIPGTGACEVLLQDLATAFNANHTDKVTVPPSVGSSGGIRLVLTDQAIMARVSQPLKEREKAGGLQYLVFARDLVVFIGGARVTVKNLTKGQLLEIYAGKIADWREAGGAPGPIRLLVREPGDSSLQVIQSHLPPFRDLAFPPGAKVMYTDPKMMEMLQKFTYSLGWGTLSSLQGITPPLHPLSLDGVSPTPANARSHQYPLICDYALVFKENRLNALARNFIDFIRSEAAQELITKYGAVPFSKE